MSRTYRRKNEPFWYTEDEALMVHPSAWREGGYSYCDSVEEYNLELKKFHSDFGWGRYCQGVPRGFVHTYCTKPLRAKERRQLNKVLKLTDYEDADVHAPFVKDAAWMYW